MMVMHCFTMEDIVANWQRVATKIVYQNHYITVHEDDVYTPDGRSTVYGWVETSPGVYVVALDDNAKVTLVKKQRYTTGQPTWELPGGSTGGQDAIEAGKHELESDAGLHADKWVMLDGDFQAMGGVATERDTVLIARGLHKAKKESGAQEQFVDGQKAFSWTELKNMIRSGELNDGQTITALTRAGLDLGHLK